jgi:tetratricopeptide (TPR) repeat protein
MSDTEASEASLAQARDAASRGDWDDAYDLFMKADAESRLSAADCTQLADVAYAAGHIDVTFTAWERAYRLSADDGDDLAAAAAAVQVAMHLLFDTALMAPVRGWVKRAERHLQGYDETPTHAWLAVARNYERLLSGDFQTAREWARRAIDLGSRLDPGAAAMGRVAEARGLILDGEVSQGLSLLNEAGVATVSGELSPLLTGVVYCELVCAFHALGQYDLADQWTEAMERWRHGQPVGSIHGRCRLHRAEILRLRGLYTEAEDEALRACEELRPYLRREFGWPLSELGRIRLRKGDIEGAEEAFLAVHEAGWDPHPGLALVHLARGDLALAASSIRDALARSFYVPSKEFPPHTDLRRAPLLEAQVDVEIALGNVSGARAAAEELGRIAAVFESNAIAAAAILARGRVLCAEGDTDEACLDFDSAIQRWTEIGAPYEVAVARMALGEARRAQGNESLALMEFGVARAIFEEVGASIDAAKAAEACGDSQTADVRVSAGARAMPTGAVLEVAPPNMFRREGDYWSVGFEGHTVMLRDLKGMGYLARLLSEPGREFHVLDLVAAGNIRDADVAQSAEPGASFTLGLDAGELLDAQAKDSYRRRLSEIEDDLGEARSMADPERAAQAEAERDFLVRELSRAVGIGGRGRRAGSAAERARVSVTRAVRQALKRIHEHSPHLGYHLERSIRTGTYCSYQPDAPAHRPWTV